MPTPTTRCLNKNLSMKFFSKCDQIRRKRQIWSHLLKKSWIENFIFFGVLLEWDTLINILFKTHKRMNPIVWSLFPQKLLKPHFKWETEDLHWRNHHISSKICAPSFNFQKREKRQHHVTHLLCARYRILFSLKLTKNFDKIWSSV